MRDEDFAYFISTWGEATHRRDVPAESVERWRGRLPDQLLTYWREEGWCGYGNGLFWTVNPEDYEDLVHEWLAGTPFERIDTFHVIARTAFGKLFACGEKVGPVLDMACLTHALHALQKDLRPKPPEDLDFKIRGVFAGALPRFCNLKDEQGLPLFDRAVQKLGQLAPDEMYALEPALVLGGPITLENLVRVKLDPHLTMLRQFSAPAIPFPNIDVGKLMRS
jgi:hypothetical protein